MLYTISGRAPSFITTGLAILLAFGMHMSAAARSQDSGSRHGVQQQSAASHQL